MIGVKTISTAYPNARLILSMASYGVQAFLTLLVVIFLNHKLNAANYIVFSLLLATGQLVAALLFEWIRISSARYEPSLKGAELQIFRSNILTLFALSAVIAPILTATIAFYRDLQWVGAALLITGALVQGAGDLILTILRSRDRLWLFCCLQISRSLLASVLCLIVSVFIPIAEPVYFAYCAGSVLPLFWVLFTDWRRLVSLVRGSRISGIKRVASFGVPAAISGFMFMAIPVFLRWLIAGTVDGSRGVAAILAIDTVQRPFFVAIGAVQGVLYPGVVAAFEKRERPLFLRRLSQLFLTNEIIIFSLIFVGYFAIPIVTYWAVSPSIQLEFIFQARVGLVLFGCQSYVQNSALMPSYIMRKTMWMVLIAAVEIFCLTIVFIYFGAKQGPIDWLPVAAKTIFAFTICAYIWVIQSPNYLMKNLPDESF